MKLNDKIYVAGHNGLLGSAILRLLKKKGYANVITRSSTELDLRDQKMVNDFFESEQPGYVFLAAAKVGGILANQTYPADFIYDNILIQSNIIHSSYKWGVEKLLFLGSSCIYPKNAPQPIEENYLMTGFLEPTNDAYAIAKIAGIKMCQAYHKQFGCRFISVMPTNLYGVGDNYHPENSHVIPGLIRRFHEAKLKNDDSVIVWGTGKPRREFLHVDDAAMACYFLMQRYESSDIINVGSGMDYTIKEMATIVKKITNFEGDIVFDETKPDGTPRKLLNVDKITKVGWKSVIDLEEGLISTYADFQKNYHYYTQQTPTFSPLTINV